MPPIDSGYFRPWNVSVPLPPEPPITKPALTMRRWIRPLSAIAAVEALMPNKAVSAMRPARKPLERRMEILLMARGLFTGAAGERLSHRLTSNGAQKATGGIANE